MIAFLDTSSLVKLYHHEPGSDHLMGLLGNGIEDIYLSELAILEFQSAMWRKVREGKLGREAATSATSLFQGDRGQFRWIELDLATVDSASALLARYGSEGLRSLDALQLASALFLKDRDCGFLTSDTLLRGLFEREGLTVLE
jgi:predicted nucleic acid-binding protein